MCLIFHEPDQVFHIVVAGALIVKALAQYWKCLLKFCPSFRLKSESFLFQTIPPHQEPDCFLPYEWFQVYF